MNPSLSDTALTIGGLLLIAGAVWGVVRVLDWLNSKIEAAVQPLHSEIATLKTKQDIIHDGFRDFEIRVSSHFVPNETLRHLENRMDEGFAGIRSEFGELRDAMLKAVMSRSGAQ